MPEDNEMKPWEAAFKLIYDDMAQERVLAAFNSPKELEWIWETVKGYGSQLECYHVAIETLRRKCLESQFWSLKEDTGDAQRSAITLAVTFTSLCNKLRNVHHSLQVKGQEQELNELKACMHLMKDNMVTILKHMEKVDKDLQAMKRQLK